MLSESSFQLHSIQLCEEVTGDKPGVCTPQACVGENERGASEDPALLSTQVLLEVGADGGSATPLRYRCPAYVVQRGSASLRDILEDSLDNAEATMEAKTVPSFFASPASASPSLVIPLPFVSKEVFEVVAVYMEHFYGLPGLGGDVSTNGTKAVRSLTTAPAPNGVSDDGSRLSSTSGLPPSAFAQLADSPSALRRPFHFADLYALSPWEHCFVLHCVLGLAWTDITAMELAKGGRWVDLAGGSMSNSADPLGASPKAAEIFSLAARQRMWPRLLAVLEAATRLGVRPLQLLCATVAANMLLDLDEGSLAQLVGGGGSGAAVPPFTPEARANLLQQFPWLSREQRSATSSAIG